ncbi:ABC transporter ATP-binding protein [Clostridium sp. KNHs205]|uniref:ABC transporter ATP-binding protein n=1 Tax=Clostridium sp. KNHs205 TaxID=1449050 RepID=UPI00051AE6A1|nr:ABC transporter ATP-binding protein [Clostridium sp. KNHs205]
MQEVILATRNLTKKYNNIAAVSDINLEVKQGQIYGIVGKNGAGKTTLLRMITGQSYATEGGMVLFGASTEADLCKERKRIGAIIETPSFYSYMSGKDNLEYYRIQRGIPGKQCVAEALEEVGLTEAANKKYKSYSLGMKQRLGLALALMNRPELLLLDEPINGLDPFGIVEIRNLLFKLNQEKNITIVISSHILSELSNLVNYYGFIDNGKLIKQLSAEDLSKECNKYIELKVDNVERMTALLETKLNCHSYKLTPDYAIHIYEYLDQPKKISELAVTNGIGLLSLMVKEINLENYFIQLVGGESND